MTLLFLLIVCCVILESDAVNICANDSADVQSLYATRNVTCAAHSQPFFSAQLNIFDAWLEWAGVDSVAGPVNASQARQSIVDALDNGFTVYRFFGYLSPTATRGSQSFHLSRF